MPGIKPIAHIANQMVAAPVAVDATRCVAMRHRAATCRACVDACSEQAIRLEAGAIVVDGLACNGCLGCVSACPTEAVSVVGQDDQRVSVSADVALENAGGIAVFACHRAIDQANIDLSAVVTVPCLASLGESLLCEQASRGAYQIALVDGGCAECPRGACAAQIDATVSCANALLSLCDAGVTVERLDAFPPEVLASEEPGYDASRRFLFTQAGSLVGNAVLNAVDAHADAAAQEQAPDDRWDPTRTFSVDKRMRLLDAIDTMGVPAEGSVQVRSFHTVEVCAGQCTGCGVCAMFCPTGALSFDGGTGVLEWSAAECSGCSLCRDVCAKQAISLKPGVACQELFDFEPRVLCGQEAARGEQATATSPWNMEMRGSLANRFFRAGRAVDPAIERMRARVTTTV
ncbi:MAG: 4Fe-4S binding protein [Coriobacteriia bacterium]|nr:4Fe-4S binding protein [Coriobacteriia bacterium]